MTAEIDGLPLGGWALEALAADEPVGADPAVRAAYYVDVAVRYEGMAARLADPDAVEAAHGLAFHARQRAQRIRAGVA